MKNYLIFVCLFLFSELFGGALVDLNGSKIWSIKPFEPGRKYWCIIRDVEKIDSGTVYHIEVVYRDSGSPVYSVTKIIPHMAITQDALKLSVIKKLKRGDIYPEQYDEARKKWEVERKKGEIKICGSSVYECFEKDKSMD